MDAYEDAAGPFGAVFTELRPLLFSIAYRMLGSGGEAEDALQEAFLRYHRALASGESISSPNGFLTTVLTRLAIDTARSAWVRHEAYIGPWLPEPLTISLDPGPAELAEQNDALSLAFLTVLQTLTPVERAVFLLRKASITAMTRSPPSSRSPRTIAARPSPAPGSMWRRASRATTPA
jgi:RNA polymerase sigma factor (sigma-70 family)